MNLQQAIEHAHAFVFPAFLTTMDQLTREREKNEEAIHLLTDAWMRAPLRKEPYSFDLVRSLADRNREICDLIGDATLRDLRGSSLAAHLSDADIVAGCAALQGRSIAEVRRTAGPALRDMGICYLETPVVNRIVSGVDIETTSRYPDRGYIINVGLAFVRLAPKGKAEREYATYCGLPEIYATSGVPLADIHQIKWSDLEGRSGFRENAKLQKALLESFRFCPYLAHNAAFEDSWFMLHLNGYAEARKAGEICVIDTRDLVRRLDPEVRTLPREMRPSALESWAKRRGTLKANEKERHLGLDDVDLMIRTVEAEFCERSMFGDAGKA